MKKLETIKQLLLDGEVQDLTDKEIIVGISLLNDGYPRFETNVYYKSEERGYQKEATIPYTFKIGVLSFEVLRKVYLSVGDTESYSIAKVGDTKKEGKYKDLILLTNRVLVEEVRRTFIVKNNQKNSSSMTIEKLKQEKGKLEQQIALLNEWLQEPEFAADFDVYRSSLEDAKTKLAKIDADIAASGSGSTNGTAFSAKIKDTFDVKIASQDQIIPTVVGDLEVKKGDAVLHLQNGEPFTAVVKDGIPDRLQIVGGIAEMPSQASPVPTPKKGGKGGDKKDKTTPTKDKSKTVKKTKAEEKAEKDAKSVIEHMEKTGCDFAKFAKDTKGTPIDAWVQGMVLDYVESRHTLTIERVVIADDTFFAELKDRSIAGYLLKENAFYKVCPTRGIAEMVDEIEVKDKKLRSQFSRVKMKVLYNYPENTDECRSLAKEIYTLRKAKQTGEAREKASKYAERCKNPTHVSLYNQYIKEKYKQIAAYRQQEPNLSYHEARKKVMAIWAEEYKKKAFAANPLTSY